MAKTLYFTSVRALTHLGTNNARLNGTASGWQPQVMSEAHGANATGTLALTVLTVAGPTNGLEVSFGGTTAIEWITDPLSADFTISGTVTLNLWAFEASLAVNAAINAVIERVDARTGALTLILQTARTTELTATAVAVNFTATPTSTACRHGDRLRLRVFADDSTSSMTAASPGVTFYYDRSTAAQGESFVTFTETLTFESAAPSGSTYYLTDTAAAINPGSATEKIAATTPGSGSVNSVTNTAAGWTAPIQVTDSAGGTAIEWYTPTLQATTIGGKALFNIRAIESGPAAEASLKAEIAVTAGDGTGAAVWGIACIACPPTGTHGEISSTADTAHTAWVAGDDTAVTAGQRLRFRVYVDDDATFALVTGFTVTVTYNGASAGAAGDSYVILPVTVTEQVIATPKKARLISSRVPAMRAALR